MAAGLAEEELQGVGRRLGHGGDGRGRLRRRRRVDDLDPALVELAQERFVLERGELVRLDEVGELVQPDRAGLLARLEERSNVVLREQAVDVDGRHGSSRALWHDTLPLSAGACPAHDAVPTLCVVGSWPLARRSRQPLALIRPHTIISVMSSWPVRRSSSTPGSVALEEGQPSRGEGVRLL